MTLEHEQWINQAAEMARAKRYDEAREFALRVIREDGGNARAYWIVATTTASLSERRNALKALLRLQPDNLRAQQMLTALDQEMKTASAKTPVSATIHPIKTTPAPKNHLLVYVALTAVALLFVVVLAVSSGIL